MLDFRAGDGIRTRDIQLGKLVLYQLSYTRKSCLQYKAVEADCNIAAQGLAARAAAL